MPVIGLVGGIGAGKSLVAGMLAQKGAHILDADTIGHVLLDQSPTREEVLERFTTSILDSSQSDERPKINRRILGAIVFGDKESRRALEAILHPRMRQTFEKAISRTARKQQAPAIVLDAAILFEAKWNTLCDFVVFVDASDEIRQERVQTSRGWNPEQLAAREASQMSLESKRPKCDFVIENVADEAALRSAVDDLWQKLIRRPRFDPSKPRSRPTPPPSSDS